MKHNLSKVKETVYVARCQWAVGTDSEGRDIVGFGLLWERKSYDDAASIVEEFAPRTYEFKGETRFYHARLEQITRYDDGSEESLIVREFNRPATLENYGTIWVCQCCMLSHANGECCSLDTDGHSDGCEPLSAIEAPFTVAMGMAYSEHAEDCETRIHNGAPDNYECDCETNTFSRSQCEGCGSYLHGKRHAMTLFGPKLQEWERNLLAQN